jgi:hypothetical protein
MPSKAVFTSLIKQGIRVDHSKFDSLDSLEKNEDLTMLLNTLISFSDQTGSHPVFTVNTLMGNPDFHAIGINGFEEYIHQHFFDSYEYYYGENIKDLWLDAIKSRILTPQFHGREHLNTTLWMRDLKNGYKRTRVAFDHGFYGLKTITSSKLQGHYLSAYYVENQFELEALKCILNDGLRMFESTFGFRSRSFIACNYTWPSELESCLKENSINFIQSQRAQYQPLIDKGREKIVYHFCGQSNSLGQRYLVRNVIFEPYLDQGSDWVSSAMKQIANAFFWCKPAIISTHRINYVSNISKRHRDHSLVKLENLLRQILRKWPDVEFMSTDEILELID